MSLREDVELYAKLSGEDGSQETIATIGAYLRGYEQGKEDAESEKRTEERTETHACDSISRQAAIDIVFEYAKRLYKYVGTPEDNEMYSYGRGLLLSIERNLKGLPPAETRRGYWKQMAYKRARICSCCGHDEPYKFADDDADIYNFCPHCGAKMEVTE